MDTIVVVGTSLAGLVAARELRAQGYSGMLVLVGEEPHRPYDRPPLSKDFLLGKVTATELALGDAEDLLALEARWLLGTRAERLDAAAGAVVLSDGTELAADGVVIATGATPTTLAGQGSALGVHTLRTLDDAAALRAGLTEGARVVVVGAGFIGAEVASTAQALGCAVTVVEAAAVPLAGVLGDRMGAVCAGLHADHGVRLFTGTGLADQGGVRCDAGGVTAVPSVVAAGDVTGGGHWTAASEQPAVAVRNLLAGSTVEHYTRPTYFWSEQYGRRIQFAGTAGAHDEVRVVEGDPAQRKFVATYHRGEVTTAVLAMDSPRLFTRLRKGLERVSGSSVRASQVAGMPGRAHEL